MDFNNQKVNKENGEAPVKGLLKKCVSGNSYYTLCSIRLNLYNVFLVYVNEILYFY